MGSESGTPYPTPELIVSQHAAARWADGLGGLDHASPEVAAADLLDRARGLPLQDDPPVWLRRLESSMPIDAQFILLDEETVLVAAPTYAEVDSLTIITVIRRSRAFARARRL